MCMVLFFFFFQAEDGIRDLTVTGVQTCALPISRIAALGVNGLDGGLRLLEPMPYLEMLGLASATDLVITDSGGLQEVTTYLGGPCVKVRPSPERPNTPAEGTNRPAPPVRAAVSPAAAT